MKKFAKMLALGLALSMTFGMAVSAAENPSFVAKDPIVQTPAEVTVEGIKEDSNVTDETKAAVVEAIDAVKSNPSSVLPGAWLSIAEVKGTFFWDATGETEVTLDVSKYGALGENENYALLHYVNGKVEYINLGKPVNGKLVAKLNSYSPFTLVVTSYNPPVNTGDNGTTQPTTPVSPKTGETLPVAGMMAVLCLAGAVVCAKKARCNN